MYDNDKRIVLTLDAGGTNFVFSALQGGRQTVDPVRLPSNADDLERCLDTITLGFESVLKQTAGRADAISFAFPGPADYHNGVIGQLPNLPAFRGGDVPLKAILEERFGIPVYINNDGALFAYGEAMAGALPRVNALLAGRGLERRYRNLLGVTLGTGFGGGAVVDGKLLVGDNCCGGNLWVFRNRLDPEFIVEQNASIGGVRRLYGKYTGQSDHNLSPLDIFNIAEGGRPGDRQAALKTFEDMGRSAGDAIAIANTVVDGLVVIGGGMAGAHKYFMPALIAEINGDISATDGTRFPRSQARAYNLEDPGQLERFLGEDTTATVTVPGSGRQVTYIARKSFGIAISSYGTSRAISMGAYAYALDKLDGN